MAEFLARLKQRKLVQWSLAYVAAAFALIQVLDVVAHQFGWPDDLQRGSTLVLVVGFFVAIVLAWYHGERGAQKVSSTEIVILALLLAIGGGLLWRYERITPSAGSPHAAISIPDAAQRNPGATPSAIPIAAIPAKSIAVLPFENLSGDKDNAYFADGMQDLILTKLADIGDLKVISRTSTAKYQSHPDNLKIIAQQLGVAAILEGSVQKAGNQVLINVQLINASSDSHVWAQSYQRTLDNVFGVEGEVAQKVADALQAKLTPTETAQLVTTMSGNAAANDLFMRAEYFVSQGNANHDPVAFRQAIPLYQQALTKDSGFALARARLSFAESGAAWFGSGESDLRQLLTDARTQAVQALAQRPRLVAAQVALGYSAYWGQGDFAGALKAFDAALALRPNDAEALGAKGFVLRRQGHLAAIDALTQALVLDPRNISLLNGLGETRTAVAQYAQAAQLFQRALDLDPENVQTKLDNSTNILMSSGDAARALDAAQGDQPQLLVWRAQLLTYQRKYRQALALIASIPETPAAFNYQVGPKALVQANLYHLAGDAAQARALFAQALSQSRARLSALAGPTVKQGFVWNHIAAAELGLGQTHAAFAAIAHSQSVASRSGDRFFTPGIVVSNAQLYAEAGRADLAVPLLAQTFTTSGSWIYSSPALLWLDPSWDPIRHDPRFQALLNQYAKYKPAVIPVAVPVSSSSAAEGTAHD